LLRGLGSSGGRVRARARVVTEPSVPPESCQGRILVARETDPSWLSLMLAAKGLVAERGTLLSHMAISGRILGIPTVVAVEGLLDRITDGTWLELDGDQGTVRILDDQTQASEPDVPRTRSADASRRAVSVGADASHQ